MSLFLHSKYDTDIQRYVHPQVVEALKERHSDVLDATIKELQDRRSGKVSAPQFDMKVVEFLPPAEDQFDDLYQEHIPWSDHKYNSTPIRQFKSQVRLECARIEHQGFQRKLGREITFPYNTCGYGVGLLETAVNAVRERWMFYGIWSEEWGREEGIWRMHRWGETKRPESDPSNNTGVDIWDPAPGPGYVWGHETIPADPQGNLTTAVGDAESSGPGRGHGPMYPLRVPKVPKPDASRPGNQFWKQVLLEHIWITDELKHLAPGIEFSDGEVDKMAKDTVRARWKRERIWNPEWEDDSPGAAWAHEIPKPPPKKPKVAGFTPFVYEEDVVPQPNDDDPNDELRSGSGSGHADIEILSHGAPREGSPDQEVPASQAQELVGHHHNYRGQQQRLPPRASPTSEGEPASSRPVRTTRSLEPQQQQPPQDQHVNTMVTGRAVAFVERTTRGNAKRGLEADHDGPQTAVAGAPAKILARNGTPLVDDAVKKSTKRPKRSRS